MSEKNLEPLISNRAVEPPALRTSQMPPSSGSAYLSGANGSSCGDNDSSLNARQLPRYREDFPIVAHSHLRWDFVWQRPQQILSRLAARHPITFMEEPIWQGSEHRLEISEPYPNVVRLVPVLRVEERNHESDTQYAVVLPLLRRAISEHPAAQGAI